MKGLIMLNRCLLAISSIWAVVALGCHVCDPGDTKRCTCGAGAPGTQVCSEDGGSWGECDCSVGDDDTVDDDQTDDDDVADDDDSAVSGPDIYCDPSQHSFGDVEIAASVSQLFKVGNAGTEILNVTSVTLTGDDMAMFTVSDDQVSGQEIGPTDLPFDVMVSFSPTSVASYHADLEIVSSDPDEPTLVVALSGEGVGPGGDGPVAVCAVNPALVHPPYEFATFQGHDSYDSDGYSLTSYDWSLTSLPAGSAASFPVCSNTSDCGPFFPDVPGTYTAELSIENEIGQSDTCSVELEAAALEDLWIEMYWVHAQDDMSLHLLAPGGTPNTDTDCYYANCVGSSPDWGVIGYAGDDPSLDLDDIPGTGPENINIPDPAAGTYTVFVDDVTGSTSDYLGGNDVTVNVYINGTPQWTDTRTMVGEGPDEYFCTVDWPSGTVTGM